MSAYYTTKAASELTGVSRQALRAYTRRYARHLSTEATPAAGSERRFTEADLRLLAFVYTHTSAGETHEQVAERLAAGELEHFDWLPPEPEPAAHIGEAASALVPIERFEVAQSLLREAERRERTASEEAERLRAEVQRLTLELGKAQGELTGVKSARYRAPAWWSALFGGREDT